MEGMAEPEARPASGGLLESNIGSRITSSMEVTSAMARSGTEPQPNNGHLPRPWFCPQEDRTPSQMVPHPPRAWGIQSQGPSVLESKVRALKESMTAGKQGASPCLMTHERPPPKKPKCRRVKVGGARTPSSGSPLLDTVVVLHAQNPNEGPLDNSVNEKEPAMNGGPRPPRLPAPGLECCSGRSLWAPETVRILPDHERSLLLGSSSSQDSPLHRVTSGQSRGPRPCNKITHVPNLRKGRYCPLQDALVAGEDLDSLSLTSEEDFVPRPALMGGLWRAGDLGALGTGRSALPLSEQVERNRLLLQEMLIVGGQGPPKVGIPARTLSWDRAVSEQPSGDMDWDSGISLQDSDQNRTFGPKPEPVLRSPRHEEARHLLQRARMKARTRPLRASHDIMPTIDQGGRDGRRNPALDRRMPFACRDNRHNGSTSDSSSGESSSGQWPKRGPSPSHVRFEDESAREAESRYLERLQQRQRQVLGPALQMAEQGPLRSKPELADYIAGGLLRRDASERTPHRLVGHLDRRAFPERPPTRGIERTCRACGSCIEDQHPALGKAAGDPQVLQEHGLPVGWREWPQEELRPGNHWAPSVDSSALCRKVCAPASFVKLAPLGPGRQDQVIGSHQPLETIPLQQSHAEPSAPHQAQQPTVSLSSEGWVPTPPSSRKTTSPGPHRKAPRPGDRGESAGTRRAPLGSVVPRTCELGPPQTQPRSHHGGHPLLGLPTNNCNNSVPGSSGGAVLEGRVEKGTSSQEPEAPLENCRGGGIHDFLTPAGVGTVSSMGVTFSLALEEPESSQEPEEGLQKTESSSEGLVSSQDLPGVSAGPGPPSAAPSDRNKKASSSITTLGLKKFFLALGQGTRPKLGKSRSCSVEQLQPPAPGPASHTSTPKVKRAPSLQSLHRVSPSHQHRKAASFQNLYSLLSGKVDRSSLYLVGEPGDHSEPGRLAKAPPRRALSVEDVGAPSLARTVGHVVEVFPDGTSQLQLQRSPEGTFGFCVASGNGRRDSGTLPPLSGPHSPGTLANHTGDQSFFLVFG
uniref:KIAA1614 n=1 Tax=Myotis lucifugus TaxID=59463 RepID=G1PYB9_MYOLU